MQFPERKAFIAILWGVGFSVVVLFFFIITKSYNSFAPSTDTYLNVIKKSELLAQMRINLHKSVEMEKNAVMAITDEESREYAEQSRLSSAAVEQDLLQIQSFVEATSLQDEKKFVGEFQICWMKCRKLDQVILELAVENTNLKAAALSQKEGVATMRRFQYALEEVMRSNLRTTKEDLVAGSAWHAIAACGHILNMHGSHIAEISNEIMDQLEMQMKGAAEEVRKALDELANIADLENHDALSQAKTTFSEFMAVNAKVLELSRKNSNAKSLELSIGKKRLISAECAEVLAAFQNAVRTRPFKSAK